MPATRPVHVYREVPHRVNQPRALEDLEAELRRVHRERIQRERREERYGYYSETDDPIKLRQQRQAEALMGRTVRTAGGGVFQFALNYEGMLRREVARLRKERRDSELRADRDRWEAHQAHVAEVEAEEAQEY